MSEWAYKTCECGNRVHIGFVCKCGRNPWRVQKKLFVPVICIETVMIDASKYHEYSEMDDKQKADFVEELNVDGFDREVFLSYLSSGIYFTDNE